MQGTTTSASGSFALRLLALIIVPLLGLGFLAIQRIESESGEARQARALVDDARFDQTVAAVYAPAQLEQIALEGLATVDELGVPRELVVALAGVDFSIYTDNAVELDNALDTLDRRFGDVVLDGGTTLSDRLAPVQVALAEQRELSDDFAAEQLEVRRVFTELDAILDEGVDAAGLTRSQRDRAGDQGKLTAVADVLRTAGDRGRALLQGLLDGSPGTSERTVAASARFELSVEQLRFVLDADEQRTLDTLIGRLEPLPAALASTRTTSIADTFDPDYVQDSAGAVLNQLDFLELLEQYSADVHDDVVDALSTSAEAAERSADRTRMLVIFIAVVSLVLLLLIATSILRPLRSLTRRAQLLGSGEFDVEPLSVRGPSDVRTLTATVNAMADTLAGVDREIARLAAGGSDATTIELPGAIGQSIDRSFRRLESMTSRLHASEMLASAIVAQAADAIWTIDDTGLILSANDASVELLGVPAARQVGTPLADHVASLDGETTVRHATDRVANVVVSSSRIDGDGASVTAVMAHDISDRLRFQERLAYQAHHDALTGLPNRFAVLAALDDAAPDQPVAALFVDLDGFKAVNDMQGHLVGDRVLTEVGNRLQQAVRRDDVVGRLGGDEFVIVMNGVSSDDEAVDFARRLIIELEQPYHDDASLFTLSASVGVATFPDGLGSGDFTPLDVIRRADSAVYAAKARGRGRVEVFDSDLQHRIVCEAEVEHALRSAIANDELRLFLQPVLDLTSNTFTSAEALVRWERPGVGLVPPGDFIPVAEKSSLIEDIGRWVLDEACATLALWKRQDPDTTRRIAVNIAGSHLLEGDLVGDVDRALSRNHADPSMLELELTESQLMDDYGRAKDVLVALRRRGIRIAIDDFGTGYSSMAYLRELPIDTLKIDRSFVAPISDSGSDTTVIDALVTIGHALGLSIVAEGIENEHQLDHLTRRGCDRAQGFLMARPMPIIDATPLVIRQPIVLGPMH